MNREDSKWWSRGYTAEWWDGDEARGLPPLARHERERFLATLTDREVEEFFRDWLVWARDEQLEPDGEYDMWLLKCGRGWGKTRTCVETVLRWVEDGWAERIAIVGQGEDDIRDVMIEGKSGFLQCAPSWNKPVFYPSRGGGILMWPNKCQAAVYSAVDTEGLRGPEFHAGWFDEPMAVPRGQRERAMNNLDFCLRLEGKNGEQPKLLMSTTPKPDPWIREVVKLAKDAENRIIITEGSTHDNKRNLAKNFLKKIDRKFAGTRVGRQEIEGKIVGDEEGALWSEELLDKCRQGWEGEEPQDVRARCMKVVVAVDPNTKSQLPGAAAKKKSIAHAAGIVVVGSLSARQRVVLADRTIGGGPEKWAKAVVKAAEEFDADEVYCESNQGGEMVRMVVSQAMEGLDFRVPIHLKHNQRSKVGRAEPVSHIYERGEVHHVGPSTSFSDLETQMVYLHEGEDPTGEDFDRCDALVMGLTRLGLKKKARSGNNGRGAGIRTIGEMSNGATDQRGGDSY